MMKLAGSYSSQKTSLPALLREVMCLYRMHATAVPERVRACLAELGRVEAEIERRFSFPIHHRDVLDVGVGQLLPQARYFSRRNRVVGIDFDVIAQGPNPLPYLRMLARNGPRRTAKTILRKLGGVDRRFRSEMELQLGARTAPRLPVLHMDVCDMRLPDATFDFVHCFSVVHSLPDPGRALGEIARVLRPGGVAYLSFHLYTSETGSLDPRLFTSRRSEIQPWSHLRPCLAGEVRPNAFLNRLRLARWRAVFEEHMPGAALVLTPSSRAGGEEDARRLQERGELGGYSFEELLTHRVEVFWRKTSLPATSP
jgi:SAM-dependent methyltransferase